ncbi:hypothetical protein V8F33_010049 [Rhypophila sp. PSN 637]
MSGQTGTIVNWWIAGEDFSDTASTADLSDFEDPDQSSISGDSSAMEGDSDGDSDSDSDAPSFSNPNDWIFHYHSDYDLSDDDEDFDPENVLIFRESPWEHPAGKPPVRPSTIGPHPPIPTRCGEYSFKQSFKESATGFPSESPKMEKMLMDQHDEVMKEYHHEKERWERFEWDYDPANLYGTEALAWTQYLQEKRDWEKREWDTWTFHDKMRRINGFTVDPQFD